VKRFAALVECLLPESARPPSDAREDLGRAHMLESDCHAILNVCVHFTVRGHILSAPIFQVVSGCHHGIFLHTPHRMSTQAAAGVIQEMLYNQGASAHMLI